MTAHALPLDNTVEARARQSLGTSHAAIYRMVADCLAARHAGGGAIVDVGCGTGNLWQYVEPQFTSYIGVDVVRYDSFPTEAEFRQVDMDTGRVLLPDHHADVATAVEVIEHLENPRAFMRELVRLTKPGGWVVITTPNQLSLLSLLTLVVRHQFAAFQDGDYPAHLTALLEVDLQRIGKECGLIETAVAYSLEGRLVYTPFHYPRALTKFFPRALSDNLLFVGRTLCG